MTPDEPQEFGTEPQCRLGPPALTEREWETSQDLPKLINWSERPATVRLGRLLAVALGRAAAGFLPEEINRSFGHLWAVEDGDRTHPPPAARSRFEQHIRLSDWTPDLGVRLGLQELLGHPEDGPSAYRAAVRVADSLTGPGRLDRGFVAAVVRDVFGNPFRPVAFDPAWRTSAAVGVARQMYETRDLSATPILADALQDAGCENPDVLGHCRDPKQVHVRGCWLVDLVLGKA